jgi:hypothetical protein
MEVTPKQAGMTRSARVSIFVNVVLICVLASLLAFALVWLVGRLAWSHDLRADLTRDDRFTVDPLAAKILRGLREPVHATFVYGIDDEIKRRVLDLSGQPRQQILDQHYRPLLMTAAARVTVVLTEWSRISEHFTFDVVYADFEPQRLGEVAARLGTTAPELARGINQVVFRLGTRERVVPMGRMFSIDWGFFPPDPRAGYSKPPERTGPAQVQSQLAETLRSLAAGEALEVGVPRGIASAVPLESAEWKFLDQFLDTQGFDAVPFDLAQGVPGDVALVMIVGMGRRLLPDEAAALKKYEESGGRLLIFADPRLPEDFRGVLEPYGAQLEAARIEDPLRRHPGQASEWVILSDELCVGNHEIDRPLVRRIGIHVGMARPIRIESLSAAGAERIPLLQASNEAKAVPVEYRQQTGEPDFLTAAKKSAPRAILGAAMRRPAAAKESRVVVFGGWEVADPQKIRQGTNYGNRDLVLNSLNWIAERHALMGIVEQELQSTRVELNPSFLSSFRWITIAGFPMVLAAIGFLVWMKRRN